MGISIWCRCFLSIFDFDSDSRPHFRSESVQRFINCNKIGYFVHRRRVCKEQWELVLTFTKLDISIWCRCFLSIFDFYSDSRPHFRSESVQRFINCNKIGFFVHKRRVCKVQWELVLIFTKLDISIWCRCFLSISILIRILDLISDPNQSRDSLIVIKLDTLYIGEGYILSLWIRVTIHLIGYIYMMQMFSFNFRFWFGF